MSNYLAIATVTAALVQLVDNAVKKIDGANVEVGRPTTTTNTGNLTYLFLYQVVPNAAIRNHQLPTRSSEGHLIQRPTVALDLHYLLAFYGNTELDAQMMLGAVARDLNASPVLTKQMIEDAASSLYNDFQKESNLAESVEQVKFTPHPISLEELSKLWSIFFQTPYALSVAYQASVVLIEAEESPSPSLPVLRRGKDDQGVDVLLGPFPTLARAYLGIPEDRLQTRRPPSFPAARLGAAVILSGQNLKGAGLFLRFRHSRPELSNSQGETLVSEIPILVENQSSTEVKVVLPEPDPSDPINTTLTDWAPGVYTVTLVKPSSTGGRDITSNGLPIALAPIIANIEVQIPKLIITCQPRIHDNQQVMLILKDREIKGEIDPNDADKVVFDITGLPPMQNELVRLRVDGIESMPFVRVDSPPPAFAFDSSQRVTIP
ncbi:DUF4255 domain-containing protein [Desulfogranum japonicum]|uniref:DUF4255 domain-containing protein n=1 Tax=Desulfogranum japonicum TaxID=231447 RepID=UPI00041C4A5F|nr:DUF4255 domain-containing protein [Desulfogranum japonicum]